MQLPLKTSSATIEMAASITLIIASKNGECTLPRVLEAVEKCTPAARELQFLFVDNASTDKTAAIFESFVAKHSGEALTEKRPGKSHALNLAIGKATGDVIAFLDDDAIPDKGWFTAWEDAFANYPDAGVFIGAVAPSFDQEPPAWLPPLTRRGMSCACTPNELAEGSCSPEYAKGLNWAVRREALGSKLFDTERNNLIHAGKAVGGQDTEMARRIAADGHGVVFVPRARAHHIVRAHEMTLDALFERYERIGRGVAAQGHKANTPRWRLRVEMLILKNLSQLGWRTGHDEFAALCHARRAMRSGRLEMMTKPF